MLHLKPLLPVLIVLMLVAVAAARQVAAASGGAVAAWARLGYGLAKISLLALPLEWLGHLFQQAEPAALSAKAVWLACLAQTLQLVLLITGMADVITGVRSLLGRATVEMHHAPLRSATLTEFWQRLLPGLIRGGVRHPLQCLPALLLTAGLGALWHGSVVCSLVWLVLHATLVALEAWRGRSLAAPLPLPLQVIAMLLMLLISSVLLISPDLPAAVANAALMFEGRPPGLYTLLLDKRLTSSWLQTILSVACIVCIALPRLDWLLQLPMRTWRVIGIGLLPLALLIPFREASLAPDWLRQAAQWPVTCLFGEGNSRVHHGHDGWLFDQAELDARTLRRTQPGLAQGLPALVRALQEAGTQTLLVPVPAKAAMHPENFLRAEYPAPVQPPGQRQKLEALSAAGVPVLDPARMLWDRKTKAPAYYAADSHWTFECMKQTASAVAKQVREKHGNLCGQDTPLINATILEREETGDLARQLLPSGSEGYFGIETAQLVSITGMEPDAAAPILLAGGAAMHVFEEAGDSFGNAEGRAQNAGFATQLALLLGRRLAVTTTLDPDALQEAARGKKLLILLVAADSL